MNKLFFLTITLFSLTLKANATDNTLWDLGTTYSDTPAHPTQDAFWMAVLQVDPDKVKEALSAGANPNELRYFFAGNKDEADTPLQFALYSKHPNRAALIDALIEGGANTKILTDSQRSSLILHRTAQAGNIDIVR